jgi:hypothetical protein
VDRLALAPRELANSPGRAAHPGANRCHPPHGAQVGLANIDASGFTIRHRARRANGGWSTSDLGGLSSEVRDVMIGAGLVGLGYLSAAPLVCLSDQL